MQRFGKFILIFSLATSVTGLEAQDWITILVHGAIGFRANLSGRTIIQVKHDAIEGSRYERNVTCIRKNPYLHTIQPIGNIGLHQVTQPENMVNAAYAFGVLYTDMMNQYGIKENNTFYTYGWSGLISKKRRIKESHDFYCALRKLLKERYAHGPTPKIRIIGYSHGATMVLNFAEYRAKEFCEDTFNIDEIIFLGTPLTQELKCPLTQPPFKKVYNIYSRGDKVQRLDISSGTQVFSDRAFLGKNPCNLTQIEIKYTAPLRCIEGQILPSRMRGTINQSPGHVELWLFGWTRSNYRQNLSMYPVPAGVFIPYLIHASQALKSRHVQVDIRPEQEQSIVSALCGFEQTCVPFLSRSQFSGFLQKGLNFHPCNNLYKEAFFKLQSSVSFKLYR